MGTYVNHGDFPVNSHRLPVAADEWCRHSETCIQRQVCREPCELIASRSTIRQHRKNRGQNARTRLVDLIDVYGLEATAKRLGRSKHSVQKTCEAASKIRERTISRIELVTDGEMSKRWADVADVRLARARIRYLVKHGVDMTQIADGCHCSLNVLSRICSVNEFPVENVVVFCVIDWCNEKIYELEEHTGGTR